MVRNATTPGLILFLPLGRPGGNLLGIPPGQVVRCCCRGSSPPLSLSPYLSRPSAGRRFSLIGCVGSELRRRPPDPSPPPTGRSSPGWRAVVSRASARSGQNTGMSWPIPLERPRARIRSNRSPLRRSPGVLFGSSPASSRRGGKVARCEAGRSDHRRRPSRAANPDAAQIAAAPAVPCYHRCRAAVPEKLVPTGVPDAFGPETDDRRGPRGDRHAHRAANAGPVGRTADDQRRPVIPADPAQAAGAHNSRCLQVHSPDMHALRKDLPNCRITIVSPRERQWSAAWRSELIQFREQKRSRVRFPVTAKSVQPPTKVAKQAEIPKAKRTKSALSSKPKPRRTFPVSRSGCSGSKRPSESG